MEEKSLKERTAGGMLWGGLSNGLMQLIGAVFGLVLLRYLTPGDYGKVAMLNIFAALASALQESGFIAALCNRKEPTHEEYNAVFWFNLLVSATLYIILWFCAPLIAGFYGDSDLIPLARVLFLGFLLSGLGTVQRAYLFGHLMVRQTSICSLTAMLVSGIVGVTMAIGGFAYWAIVTQAVCFVLITQLMAWYFSPWRPTAPLQTSLPSVGQSPPQSLRCQRAIARGGRLSCREGSPPPRGRGWGRGLFLAPAWRMFGFSSKLMLTNIVNICNLHAFSVLLGKFFGDYTAGIYTTARKWDDMASSTINGMVTGVAQPTLAQVTEDLGRYRQVFRKMLRFICFVSFPAMLGLGLVAQEFILLAGGEKWRESGLILSLLCIHGAFVPITTLYSNLTISRGRSGVNMGCTIGQCLAVWVGLILLYPHGMLPMVIYFVALNVAWLVIWQWFAWRLTGLTFMDALKDIMPFLVFTLAVLGVTWWLTNGITNLWLLLISRILIAGVLYAGIMWVCGAKIMREAIQYLVPSKSSRGETSCPSPGGRRSVYFYHTQDTERIVREWKQGRFSSHFLYGALQLGDYGIDVVWHHQKHTYKRWRDTMVATWKVLTCRKHYDILYATHTYGIEPVVLLRALGLYRHPIIAWHHQPIVKAKSPLREAFARLFYRGLDHMIFFSEKLMQDSLLSAKADSQRMSMVHWGADLEYYDKFPASFQPSRPSPNLSLVGRGADSSSLRSGAGGTATEEVTTPLPTREGLGVGPGGCFISTGKELRDYETLLKAFHETGLPLTLYVEKKRQAYFEGLHPKENIEIHYGDRLMPHEIAQQVAQSRCVCVCCQKSNYTVGLTTVVEALALGLPILCTRNPQMPMDIEAEGCGFWIEVGDVEGWKEKLRYIADHPEEAKAMGKRGRAIAEQYYNIEQCGKEVAALVGRGIRD